VCLSYGSTIIYLHSHLRLVQLWHVGNTLRPLSESEHGDIPIYVGPFRNRNATRHNKLGNKAWKGKWSLCSTRQPLFYHIFPAIASISTLGCSPSTSFQTHRGQPKHRSSVSCAPTDTHFFFRTESTSNR
jgi:hypothetical protein